MSKKIPAKITWQKVVVSVIFAWMVWQSRLGAGEYLIGWDNLQTELAWDISFSRIISGAWQEYQGVGLPGGMAHIADLPRLIILWFVDLFVPSNWVRWLWHVGMLALGMIGVWKLGKSVWKWRESSASLASLFYLLNMATIQYFYVPYESFSAFYGFLPWLLYVFWRYINTGKERDLLWVAIVGLLSASSFYVQTLFVVYIILVLLLVLKKHTPRKRLLKVFLVIILINLYWLAPVILSSLKSGSLVGTAKINDIGSVETTLMNRSTGNIFDLSRLKGYWIEYLEWINDDRWGRLMQVWWQWSESVYVQVVSVGLFVLGVSGIVGQKRKRYFPVWIGILGITYFMLSSFNAPFGGLYEYFVKNLPLFGEAFRSVFTKWSVVMALTISLGLGNFLDRFDKVNRSRVFLVLTILIAFTVKPVFSKGMFFDRMKNRIPEEYFELFDYMRGVDKQARVASYPVQSFWSWKYYDWGYRGSGFLWYGIEQPILDRAFDVWSPYNEGFYQEISRSVYTNNAESVRRVFDKYDISYLLIDESIIQPGGDESILKYDEMKELLANMEISGVWSKGRLSLYKIGDSNNFIEAPREITIASGDNGYVRVDNIYTESGDYMEIDGRGVYYPYVDLMREKVEGVSYRPDIFTGIGKVSIFRDVRDGYNTLTLPEQKQGATMNIWYESRYENGTLMIQFEPIVKSSYFEYPSLPAITVNVADQEEEIIVDMNGSYMVLSDGGRGRGFVSVKAGEDMRIMVADYGNKEAIDVDEQFVDGEVTKCWNREGAEGEVGVERGGDVLKIRTKDAAGCLSLRLGDINPGIIDVSLPNKSPDGARANFCLNKQGGEYKCLHDDVFYSSPTRSEWFSVDERVSLKESGVYWLDVTARPSDTVGEEWTIEYQSPTVTYYPRIEEYVVGREFWSNVFSSKRVEFEENRISVSMVPKTIPIDLSINKALKNENCDVLDRGSVNVRMEQGVVYEADGYGIVCDSNRLGMVDPEGEYLLRWVGENEKGRSLKFYLYSTDTRRSELEYLLPEGEFDHTVSVLGVEGGDSEYSLTAETRSFGELSRNRVEAVSMYPVPLNWLSRIKVGEEETLENGFEVKDVRKIGTFMYVVDGMNEGEGFVTLSQGYDEGWIAWVRGEPHEFLKHYRVSGWKNGWLIGEKDGELVDQGEIRLVMLFWPQLLQYAGFGIMGMALVWLLWTGRKK